MLHQCAVLCNKLLQTILNCTKLHPTNQNVEVGLTGEHMKICDECETVAHCTKHGCIPKRDFWEGYVPESVRPAVPDAFGTREGEHPEYVQGWNDCRAEMLNAKQPAQPEQEFVCSTGLCHYKTQRTWVGLTIEEKRQLFDREDYQGWLDYINAIEAKLRSKNEDSN